MGKINFDVHSNGCFICTSHYKNSDGYPNAKIRGKTRIISRFIFEECFGEIPEGMVVRHKCDNPSCINPEHLELGTHKQNVNDRVQRNRSAHGESHGRAKLTEKDVVSIRNSRLPIIELSKKYSVDPKTIRLVKERKIWKHVC